VTLPTITVKVTGLLNDGQKSYIKSLILFYKNINLYLSPLLLCTCCQKQLIANCFAHILMRNRTCSSLIHISCVRTCKLRTIKDNKQQPINLFSTQCRAIKRIGPHNLDIVSTIYGLLLGGSLKKVNLSSLGCAAKEVNQKTAILNQLPSNSNHILHPY